MPTVKPIDWRTNYIAFFGSRSAVQFEAWQKVWAENVTPPPTQSDINNAVARLCATWDSEGGRRNPACNDIMWILKGRPQRREREPAHMAQAKRDLREESPSERWNIVCDAGNTVDDCDALLAYCRRLPGGCVDQRATIKAAQRRWLAEIGVAWRAEVERRGSAS